MHQKQTATLAERIDNALPLDAAYEYRVIAATPPVPDDEIDDIASGVEVRVLWGRNLLHVSHLNEKQTFHLGEHIGGDLACDYFMPESKLGTTRAPVVLHDVVSKAVLLPAATGTVEQPGKPSMSFDEAVASGLAAPCAEVAGAHSVALTDGMKVCMHLRDVTVELTGVRQAKKRAAAFTLAALLSGAAVYVLGSFIGHAGLLFAMASFMPSLGATTDDSLTDEQRIMIQYYLDTAAETELEAKLTEQIAEDKADEREGGTGLRAKAEEGAMGSETSRETNGRWANQGPQENQDPHVARDRAMADARAFGMIGLLNIGAGGDPDAPTAPWGRLDNLGNDPLSANGNMWGNQIGEAAGASGLGLSGIGEGGGGFGEGIGMGNIGTYGHGAGLGLGQGMGDGFGGSHGHLQKQHKVKAPSVRIGRQTVSGRIPPEVIQRIVRQNYGRFRLCYQKGLQSNPALEGRVSVGFVIGRDGRVSNVGGSGDIPDSGVVKCVTRSFYGLSFPQPEGGIVTVRYPIVFTPGS